jgi:heme-degrading monooxygenase HmoA
MLVRIVKMHFNSAYTSQFKLLFDEVMPLIAKFEGCDSVQLLHDETEADLFFTISRWKTAKHLENYRNSALFKTTWAKVKPNFKHKAEAWSLLEN